MSGRRPNAALPANYSFRSLLDKNVVCRIRATKQTDTPQAPAVDTSTTVSTQAPCLIRLTWLAARPRVKEEVAKLRAMKPLALNQELLDPLMFAQKFLAAVGAAPHLDIGFIDVLLGGDLNAIEPYLCQHWLDLPTYEDNGNDSNEGNDSDWQSVKDIVAKRLASDESFVGDEAGATAFMQELLESLKGDCSFAFDCS